MNSHIAFVTAFTMAFTAAMPLALAKDLPKSAKAVSDAEHIKLFSGKSFRGKYYGKNGKAAGKFSVSFKRNGTKTVSVTPAGKKSTKKTLKWYVKGGKFCDEAYATGKAVCGTRGTLYKIGGTCYTTQSNKKTVRNEFRC